LSTKKPPIKVAPGKSAGGWTISAALRGEPRLLAGTFDWEKVFPEPELTIKEINQLLALV